MSPSKKTKPSPERTVKVEILVCPAHGVHAVSIDGRRITESRCCGSWRMVRQWDVRGSEVLAALGEGSRYGC